jgi:transposase InsO family protein
VERLMSANGIRARHKRRYRVTTDSRHKLPVAPNVLNRNFTPAEPNQVFTSDITYIWTDDGWLYLAVTLDLFNREVAGWSVKPRMTTELVTDVLTMAWFRRRPAPGALHHSDRGAQLRFKGSWQHLMFMTRVVDLSVLLLVLSIQGFYAVCNLVRLRRHQVRAACTG